MSRWSFFCTRTLCVWNFVIKSLRASSSKRFTSHANNKGRDRFSLTIVAIIMYNRRFTVDKEDPEEEQDIFEDDEKRHSSFQLLVHQLHILFDNQYIGDEFKETSILCAWVNRVFQNRHPSLSQEYTYINICMQIKWKTVFEMCIVKRGKIFNEILPYPFLINENCEEWMVQNTRRVVTFKTRYLQS